MHFYPTKKELDLPSGLVESTDAQGRQDGVVADEQQTFAGLGILVTDTAKGLGVLPRKSSSVCIFTAALVVRNGAHGNSDSDKSIVVESRAYAVLARSTPNGSLIYSLRAMPIRRWAKSAYI